MRRGFRFVLVLILCGIGGCSSAAIDPQRLPELSTDNPSANAPIIAEFIRQQCTGEVENSEKFEEILAASGWNSERLQTMSVDEPLSLDVWQLSDGQLIRGILAKGEISTCSLALEPDVAPIEPQIVNALSNIADGRPDSYVVWNWNPYSGRRIIMNVGYGENADARNLFIHIENYQLSWWQTILG